MAKFKRKNFSVHIDKKSNGKYLTEILINPVDLDGAELRDLIQIIDNAID